MLITQENSLLIFGDSGFSRSGGALKIALSTSRNLAIREGIHMYLDVFIAIYGYLFFIYLYLKITL